MLRRASFPQLGLILVCVLAAEIVTRLQPPVLAGQSAAVGDPNAACAQCHQEIYRRYRETPMANASGPAVDGLISADFNQPTSGIHYAVFQQTGRVWLSYEREPERELKGRIELKYFLGSGKRGRTYLFQQQGYWFEAPINWYAKKRLWDMTPNYLNAKEMPLTLPVDPWCLHCHASAVAPTLGDARNHYAAAPFAYGGITCTACHGDGAKHAASGGKTKMLDIDALKPVRRDSVCLSCHLEGQAAVVRFNKQIQDFVPGEDLFDYTLFFVHRGESGSGGRATSQYEALLKSRCKQGAGDRMTCTTCHDPHGSPSAEERVAFYRERCLRCHNQTAFAAKHHPENPDCTSCHMAHPPSNDIAHEQVTDHWIKRRVSQQALAAATTGDLEVVGGFSAGDRDLGLAYAQMAARGDRQSAGRAIELLHSAEQKAGGAPSDHQLHAQLGFLYQVAGHPDAAAEQYRKALAAETFDSLAAGNLALIEAGQHHLAEATQLWQRVFSHDPVQLGAGLNLAVVQCSTGQRKSALATLDRLLVFAPDNGKARAMAAEIRFGKGICGTD